jgi:hypothetical protein
MQIGIRDENRITEKKFFHDYAYALFEKQLLDDKKVFIATNNTLENFRSEIDKYSFVKVKGKATFTDMNLISNTMENFNEFGRALAYITAFDEINKIKEEHKKTQKQIGSKKQKQNSEKQLKSLFDANSIAVSLGLNMDQTLLEKMSYVLKYGLKDQFEVQINSNNVLYSSSIIREYLREKENLMIKKYSRITEKEFVIFGIVTQHSITNDSNSLSKVDPLELNDETDCNDKTTILKKAIMNIVKHLTKMEATFTGRLSNEVIIDPIAIYSEL